MQLTESILQRAVAVALSKTGFDKDDFKRVAQSVKCGLDAQDHTGSQCEGYFCIEDSILSSCYYDAPGIYHQFIEDVNESLNECNSMLFVEPSNSVEFVIYK